MKCNVNVNRKLLPGKFGLYAMVSAGLWSYPFMILFFKSLGLTTTECSIIYGILPLFAAVTKMVFGAIADKLQRHKEMTLLFSIISATLMSCMLLIPKVAVTYPEIKGWDGTLRYACRNMEELNRPHVQCLIQNISYLNPMDDTNLDALEKLLQSNSNCAQNQDSSFAILEGCLNNSVPIATHPNGSVKSADNYICQLDCANTPDGVLNPPEPVKETYGKTFWLIFFLYFLASNVQGSMWGLLYGMVYAVLGENRNNFGRQRLWGTIGALSTSILTAVATNKYGSEKPEINFVPCFIGFAIWIILTGVACMFFKVPNVARNPTMARDIFRLVKQPQITLLFTVLFVMGFLFGAVETFLFVFLRSLGASSFVLGACLFIRYICEIPSLYYSGRIIKRFGHIKCLYLVLFVYSIRYLGTSLIPSPWWELPFSAMKSVVFSIGFTAVSVYCSAITPPSMHATLQATVQTIHYGIGRGIGILIFGPTMDTLGARWTFRIGSAIALVTLILYAVIQQFMPPVKLITHDGDLDKDAEVKEALNGTAAEVKVTSGDEDPDVDEEPANGKPPGSDETETVEKSGTKSNNGDVANGKA